MYTIKDYNNEFGSIIEKKKLMFGNEIKSPSQIQLDQMLEEQIFRTPEYRRKQLEKTFTDLLKLQREIKLLLYKISMENERHECKKLNLELERNKVKKSCHLDNTEKELLIKQMDNDYINDKNKTNEINDESEIKMKKCKISVKCVLRDLANLKSTFEREHNLIIDKMLNFKLRVTSATADIVQKKILFFEDCFANEIKKIEEYETNLTNPLYQLDIKDDDDTSSKSTCNCQSTSKSSSTLSFNNLIDGDCKIDDKEKDKDQEYIRQHLAKPLVQALSAITLYQPTDPIYFLANYLFHCRHNELMHSKKDHKFEMLMNERKELEKPKPKCVCVDCDNLVTGNEAVT